MRYYRSAKNKEACNHCGKATQCCCLLLLAHPAYAYLAFLSPAVVTATTFGAYDDVLVLPFTVAGIGELGSLWADFGLFGPKMCEATSSFFKARNEASLLRQGLSTLKDAAIAAPPKPKAMQ